MPWQKARYPWQGKQWHKTALGLPENLAAAIDETSGGIELSWDAADGADSYNIYYAIDEGAWQSESTDETGTNYTFTPADPGSYSFAVTSVSGSSESDKAELIPSGLFDDVPDSEGIALMALYEQTGGDNWTDNTNWLTDSTVGNWYGITVSGGYVTEIDLDDNGLNGEWTADVLSPLTGLTNINACNNSDLNCSFALSDLPSGFKSIRLYNTLSTVTGVLSDLPSGMERLYLQNTDSTITGDLSDLPSGMQSFYMLNTPSAFTGALSDLPSRMLQLYVQNTSSVITGGESTVSATGLTRVKIQDCSADQTTVDSVLQRLYTDRAIFTHSFPDLNISGNNAAPSGTYQYSATPSTGLEYAYALEHDDDAEGFNLWDITMSGVFTDVSNEEGFALVDLYYATNGDSWTDNTNWVTDPTVGNWFGTTVSGGHVTGIDFGYSSNGLSGDIGTTIKDLAYLDRLVLWSNTSQIALTDLPTLVADGILGIKSTNASGSLSDIQSDPVLQHMSFGDFDFGDENINLLPTGSRNYLFTSCDVTGDLSILANLGSNIRRAEFSWTNISAYTSTVLPPLTTVKIVSLGLAETEVDNFLSDLDTAGGTDGTLDISGSNAVPSATGESAIDSLRSKGWTVTVAGGY